MGVLCALVMRRRGWAERMSAGRLLARALFELHGGVVDIEALGEKLSH